MKGTGWLPSLPSLDDFSIATDTTTSKLASLGQPSINSMLQSLGIVPEAVEIPNKVDLSGWFSPIRDQGNIGSCTAFAVVGLAEYYVNKAFKKNINLSELFVYKMTRNLLGWRGDTGAFLRTAMGALTLCGAPPESFSPYVESRYDREPSAFLYSVAQSFQATSYYRLDAGDILYPELLDNIRAFVANGLPLAFGYTVYESMRYATYENEGAIPFPVRRERIDGGHAMIIVGYDDDREIFNPKAINPTVGAFKVRNQWGPNWGNEGYGWMPYAYVTSGLATDFWGLMQQEWVETEQFGEKAKS
jgi:C1A family cysteine protease